MSMKPGDTASPPASNFSFVAALASAPRGPMVAMRSPTTPMSPLNVGLAPPPRDAASGTAGGVPGDAATGGAEPPAPR